MGPLGNRRAPVAARVAFGEAELRPDPARPQGWTLLVNGVPQSYVDLADPGYLAFAYVEQLGRVLRSWAPGLVRSTVLHLGGGGLTLARLLAHTRPEAAQRVVERDPALLALVLRVLPFPGSIEVEVGDARAVLEGSAPGGYDLIIADVFDGAAMPVSVAERGFARAASRALRPGGLLVMNLTDVPPLAYTRIQVATVSSVFGADAVALLGAVPVLRARRAGNVILLAGGLPAVGPSRQERLLRGSELVEFAGGARARQDTPG
ncbi:spermidine synthase [Micromonosporaceae bacterium Da 78-11]